MVVGESGGVIKIIAPKVDADRKTGGVKEKGSKAHRNAEASSSQVVGDKVELSPTVKDVITENRLAAQNGLEDFEAANQLLNETIALIKEGADKKTVGETSFLLMNPKKTVEILESRLRAR